MTTQEIIRALHRLQVETGSLACLGCAHENSCSTKGCAVIRAAVTHLEKPETVAAEQDASVAHGRWIVDKEGYGERIVHCSVCGKRSAENRYTSMEHGYSIECCYAIITDFYPSCGAKMDKEE